nr:uncharacterized protein CI109_006540 [Kwoniella shandongensis]KAA5525170.1 hypothetical protein CI109_006540 [Kwoniella shandongensis]
MPSSAPKYIYKIIPHSSVDPRFTFPVPIPASHTFLTPIDLQDRFIHFSAAERIPTTLNLYFNDVPSVTILRIESERIGAWKKLEWLDDYRLAHATPVPLEGEHVESFREVHKKASSTSGTAEKQAAGGGRWEDALQADEVKGWLL